MIVSNSSLHGLDQAFGGTVLAAELESAAFFRMVPFLESWAMRGLFQTFVGVLVMTGSLLDSDLGVSPLIDRLNVGVSWYLVGTGCVYVCMVRDLCFSLPPSNESTLLF